MFRRLPSLLLCLSSLTLAGCAPAHVPWSNPALPKDRWERDWNACKREAEGDILGYGSNENDPGPIASYDRANAKKRIDASVAGCMAAQGYVPAGKGK